METAAYNYLKVSLGNKEALALYYRLTAFIREHDATSFSMFMAFRDSTLTDYALMDFVLHIMVARHYDTLLQLMPATEKEADA